jgi:hypothetical protein
MQVAVGRAGAVVAGATVLVVLGGVGGAVAGALVTSAGIKDETIRARDIAPGAVSESEVRNGSVDLADLSTAVRDELAKQAQDGADGTDGVDGAPGADGMDGVDGTDGVAQLESDGARPGATQLSDNPGNGANSTEIWAAGPNAGYHSSWVACPEGKTALGGGYSRDTETGAAVKGLQVVTSAPAQIDPTASDEPDTVIDERIVYHPIEGDKAGSFVPNGWLVEGFNNGNVDLIVRPWVICAAVND